MEPEKIMRTAETKKASDIHITVGQRPVLRIDGLLYPEEEEKIMTAEDTKAFCTALLDETRKTVLQAKGQVDFAYQMANGSRFRVNVFKQKKHHSAVLRRIDSVIRSLEELQLPSIFKDFAQKEKGMILITGMTGSGKSTTLAALIDHINQNYQKHIITLEDPIEYLHEHKTGLINQRELGRDFMDFSEALTAVLRQDPDVILVGEMRDLNTISTAITAAETGHLVLATLHTSSAAESIERIIDVFPPHQQQLVRVQLASVVEGIVAQKLMPCPGGGRVAAQEILTGTAAIKNLIREGKTHQIYSMIQTGSQYGMQTMENALDQLRQQGKINPKSV